MMKKAPIFISIIAVVVLICGITAALYSQVLNPVWNPFRPEPEEVLRKAALSMKELKSFHVEGDFEIKSSEKSKYEDEINSMSQSYSLGVILNTDRNNLEIKKDEVEVDVIMERESEYNGRSSKDMVLASGYYIRIGKEAYVKVLSPELLEGMTDDMPAVLNRWIKIDEEGIEDLMNYIQEESGDQMEIKQLSREEQEKMIEEIMLDLTDLFEDKRFYEIKAELPDKKIEGQKAYHYLLNLNEKEIKRLIPDIVSVVSDYVVDNISSEEYGNMGPEMMMAVSFYAAEIVDNFFDKVGEVEVEILIGQKDGYIHQIKFEKEMDLTEEKKVEEQKRYQEYMNKGWDWAQRETLESKVYLLAQITFSEFNQDLDIEAPSNFKTLKETLIKEIGKSRGKARDARRQSDIRQMSLAMEMYYNDNMAYLKSSVMPLVISNYLDPVPADPGGGSCDSYQWISNIDDSEQYCVWACLENGKFFAASMKGTKELNEPPVSLDCW